MPPAWDVVEPQVTHNSCATLEQWARSNCLIMFLDGTGESFFKRSPASAHLWSGCSGFHRRVRAVNGRGVFSLVSNKPFPDLRHTLGFRRFAMHRVKNLCCCFPAMNISCPRPRKGGRTEWVSGGSFGNQYWDAVENHPAAISILKVKSHASEWSRWSGQGISQSGCSWRPDVRKERVCQQTGGQRG